MGVGESAFRKRGEPGSIVCWVSLRRYGQEREYGAPACLQRFLILAAYYVIRPLRSSFLNPVMINLPNGGVLAGPRSPRIPAPSWPRCFSSLFRCMARWQAELIAFD